VFYTIFEFPLGKIFLAKSSKGLVSAHFLKTDGEVEKAVDFFRKRAVPLERDEQKLELEKELFKRYFTGEREDFTSLLLDLTFGTSFQRKVWLEARKIPYGKTATYKSLALKLKHRGFRSIGQAMSKNPLLIVIPCHRVLGSDGSLGGFSAGLELKKFLLRLEREETPT